MSRHAPVAVVIDADTSDAEAAREQELIFNDFVRALPITAPCRLFLAIPTLKDALFPTVASFERVTGIRLSDEQQSRVEQDKNAVLSNLVQAAGEQEQGLRGGRAEDAKDGFGNPFLKSPFVFLKSQKPIGAAA